jgi:hypothetical protein
MKHQATSRFWSCYESLPAEIRLLADKNFELLKSNPNHPSLRLKKVGVFWSARIGRDFRALAVENTGGLTWVWIGSHGDYDRLVSSQ